MNATAPTAWIVTRYIDGKLTTYTSTNWNHVGIQIALGRIVSWEPVN